MAARLQTKRCHYTPIQSSHYSPELLHAAESLLKADQIFILAFERIWKNHWQSVSDQHRLLVYCKTVAKKKIRVSVQLSFCLNIVLSLRLYPEPFLYLYLQMLFFFLLLVFFGNKNQRLYLKHINIHAAQPRLSALWSRCHTAPASFQNYQKSHRQATRHH